MKALCRGSCFAQTFYDTVNLCAENRFYEDAELPGLFPETRLSADSGRNTDPAGPQLDRRGPDYDDLSFPGKA